MQRLIIRRNKARVSIGRSKVMKMANEEVDNDFINTFFIHMCLRFLSQIVFQQGKTVWNHEDTR
jgi:hypothetical protein